MTADRARGVVLYGCAAALLVTGAFWWVRTAPDVPPNPLFERWEAIAERRLPDVAVQSDARTLTLAAGAEQEVLSDVGSGEFVVSVLCVGGAESRVRVSLGDPSTDTGRGLPCFGEMTQANFNLRLVRPLRMTVIVDEEGPVVFRYSVLPTNRK